MKQKTDKTKLIGLFLILFVGFLLINKILPNEKTLSKKNSVVIPPSPVPPKPKPTLAPSSDILHPSQILNLTNWKITLPIGKEEKPDEIKQPQIMGYQIDPWFMPEGSGVRFRAPVNGVTTSGSSYPRSELREMINNGEDKAEWSSNEGNHAFYVDEEITAVPAVKQHVVSAQIHDDEDDVLVVRLEYPRLYVNVDGKNVKVLDENYTLGKRFTIKFEVSNGETSVYYNNSSEPVYTLKKNYSGAYFKAGAYTQSNCEREGIKSLCNSNNYGEVIIYSVTSSHE